MRLLLFMVMLVGGLGHVQGPTCAHGTYGGSVVAFGDSITEGYGTTDDSCSFALDLQDVLHQHVTEVARGGYRTDQMLPQLPAVLALHPDIVVVELGTNDVRFDVALDVFRAHYAAIMQALVSVPTIYCLSVWPSPGFTDPALLASYNLVIRQTCAGFFLDITSLALPELTNPTNWHPNNLGAYLIAAHIMPIILPAHLK